MSVSFPLERSLSHIQSTLQLTDEEIAGAVHATPRTIARWRTNSTFPQREARQRLDALDALSNHLLESFGSPAAVKAWLNADSEYLGGLKPIDALRVGRIDRVEAAIEALDSGIYI